ncbi:MAG: hypothetical protein JST91_29845 [Actinobacteria bacterium]|nr:hypothetical protein [Actinomycetota bacterium]
MTDHNFHHSAPPPRIMREPSTDYPTEAFAAAAAPPTERIASAAAHARGTAPPPIVLRRARPAVFIAPQPEEGTLVSRDIGLGRSLPKQPELSRNRKIAGNLPSWDPLPPGEIRVTPRRQPNGL